MDNLIVEVLDHSTLAALLILIGVATWHIRGWIVTKDRSENSLEQHLKECRESSKEVEATLTRIHQRINQLSMQISKLEGIIESSFNRGK